MREIKGTFKGEDLSIAIVVSRFNELVTQQLLSGAIDGLMRHGVCSDDITVIHVPGAFEIPLATKRIAATTEYDAIICLGAVIRGSTTHFDLVINQATAGIAKIALDYDIPVIFEILATDTFEQAMERAGGKMGNKGFEAAMTAIEMATLSCCTANTV